MFVVEASEEVQASADEVLSFVMDIDRYRLADHKITTIRSLERERNEVVASMWTRMGPLRIPAKQRMRLEPGKRIDVTNEPSWQDRIVGFHGEFVCDPAGDDGQRTLVHPRVSNTDVFC